VTPTEIADNLNEMWVELSKLGAFDQHAAVILRLTENTMKLAREVQRLEAEATGGGAAVRMMLDSMASTSFPTVNTKDKPQR
jgi:hypothetical protein